jgi:hypothetical protein
VPTAAKRYVSFYPLRADAMAVAFSGDEWATLDIAPHPAPDNLPAPDQPIWISVSGPALHDVNALPTGARSFVTPLESAENITVSIGPSDDHLQVNLNVACASETAASDLVTKLEGATNMLRKMLERENMKPNPRDLSGLLVTGNFRRQDRRVVGVWPMQRAFIEAVASGSVD